MTRRAVLIDDSFCFISFLAFTSGYVRPRGGELEKHVLWRADLGADLARPTHWSPALSHPNRRSLSDQEWSPVQHPKLDSPSRNGHISSWGLAFLTLVWPMTKALWTKPWRVFGSDDQKRAYWRNIALVMIRTGGYWFSIRHLQFLMPNVAAACWIWGLLNSTSIFSEEVEMTYATEGERNPWIRWIGSQPPKNEAGIGRRRMTGKVLLYVHGGGFVLPLSNGCLTMVNTMLREARQTNRGSQIYLALAEYTISPYADYPTQIRQCITVISHLYTQYDIESSSLILAGDSCGGSIICSILSQLLHPSPVLPSLPYTKGSSSPFLGVLLISPWTSFSTTAASYTDNAATDTLPPNVIRRFRDSYIGRSALLSKNAQIDAFRSASLSGRYYPDRPDPQVKGLQYGAGAIRPLESFVHSSDGTAKDPWWDEIGAVVRRVMITTGELECFRDDILSFAAVLEASNERQTSRLDGETSTATIELVRDDSFHAVLVSDFAFGAPAGTLAAKLSGWFVDTLQD